MGDFINLKRDAQNRHELQITTFSEVSNSTFDLQMQEYLQKSVEGF